MSYSHEVEQAMRALYATLSERDRRRYAAIEAAELGHGGMTYISSVLGCSYKTIRRGQHDLSVLSNGLVSRKRIPGSLHAAPDEPQRPMHEAAGVLVGDRIRRPGGGSKPIEVRLPGIEAIVEKILTDEVAGDPMGGKRWVRSSLRRLSKALKDQGYDASSTVVSRLLRDLGYSPKANERKQGQSKPNCPERDEQFQSIAAQRQCFIAAGRPVISVDTKKKELIGNFRRPGKTWCKKPTEVNEHDYSSQAGCLAVPFGIYDVAKNTGYVVVGLSHNTPEFATSSISSWWQDECRGVYPGSAELLILADGGGGNGYRSRAWRWNLQVKICNPHRLTVTVCHYPPGCSKWNPVEHRLFSQISNNWAGIPLRPLAIMLGYIRGTTTTTGLTVKAVLDEGIYPKGQKVSWKDVDALNLTPHEVCPEWNYTIRPSE
jgi:Rhodopirellula transposase DDE domain